MVIGLAPIGERFCSGVSKERVRDPKSLPCGPCHLTNPEIEIVNKRFRIQFAPHQDDVQRREATGLFQDVSR